MRSPGGCPRHSFSGRACTLVWGQRNAKENERGPDGKLWLLEDADGPGRDEAARQEGTLGRRKG